MSDFKDIFHQLNTQNRLNCVRFSAVFPRTENVTKGRSPILETTYECTGRSCDFTKSINDIKDSAELKSYDQISITEEVYDIISKDQDFYLAHKVDHISLQKNGYEIVRAKRLSRESSKEQFTSTETTGRSCFIEMNSLRQQSLILNQPSMSIGFFQNPVLLTVVGTTIGAAVSATVVGCTQFWLRNFFNDKK